MVPRITRTCSTEEVHGGKHMKTGYKVTFLQLLQGKQARYVYTCTCAGHGHEPFPGLHLVSPCMHGDCLTVAFPTHSEAHFFPKYNAGFCLLFGTIVRVTVGSYLHCADVTLTHNRSWLES
jgi:hypothetical protein